MVADSLLFRRPVPGSLGSFTGSLTTLGAVRFPDRHAAFGNEKGLAVLFHDLVRVFLRQPSQFLQQPGIMGIDFGGSLGLVVEDLSEKNNYPSKSEEYMANQVFYQIFFG